MQMGAHTTFMYNDPDLQAKLDEYTNGNGVDLVILTANPWPAYRTSVEIVRENGRVSIVSLLGRGEEPADFNPLAMQYFYHKGISIIAVNGTAPYQYPQADADRMEWNKQCEFVLQLMADGSLTPSQIVTHRLPYTRMQEAYEMAYHREKTMLGVIFQWGE